MPVYLNGKYYSDIQIGSKIKADLPALTNPAGKDQILENYQAINSNGEVVNGNIIDLRATSYDVITLDGVTEEGNYLTWSEDIAPDTMAYDNTTTFYLPKSEVIAAAGLTANKIVSGNTILGIVGAHTCNGTIGNITCTHFDSLYSNDGVFTLNTNITDDTSSLIGVIGSFVNGEEAEIIWAFKVNGQWNSTYFDSSSEEGQFIAEHFDFSDSGVITWALSSSSAMNSAIIDIFIGNTPVNFYLLTA